MASQVAQILKPLISFPSNNSGKEKGIRDIRRRVLPNLHLPQDFPLAQCVCLGVELRGQALLRREVMSCTDSLTLHVSVGQRDLPTKSRGMENSSLRSRWLSLYEANAWKHRGCAALLANGEVWPEDCKMCYFCNFHPCNYMEYNREDYLDSTLTLFPHYSSSSKDGG